MADSSTPDLNLYGYVPSPAAGYVFVIIFILTTLFHTFQAARSGAWWLFPTLVIAGVAEVVGWVARTKSAYDATLRMLYIIQTTVLVLAPTPLVAALFMGFGKVVQRLGSEYSRLSPTWYSRFFLTIDIFSLFIQGAGGGMAAQGASDPDKARLGSNIILGGLFVQIISMSFFSFLMAEYTWRRSRNQPFHKGDYSHNQQAFDGKMKMLLVGIVLPTFLVYIRSIYRIAEFADGFNGSIAHNQTLFIIFDALMISLALVILNIMHPGTLLKTTAQNQTYALTSTDRDRAPLQY